MASFAISEKMEYSMKKDGEVSLICDMSELENHLIHQQNYSQQAVTKLIVFLAKQPNKSETSLWRDIRVLLDNHTVDDVTLQSAAVFYINPGELVQLHHHNIDNVATVSQ